MAYEKDEKRASVHILPLERHSERTVDVQQEHADDAMSDLLLDALQRLADDMLNEPVPDRLLDALRQDRVEDCQSTKKR